MRLKRKSLSRKSALRVRGFITLTVTDTKTGLKYVVYDGPNLIVDTGLTDLVKLLGQTDAVPATHKITNIKFGTSSTAAAAGQTDIVGTLIANKVISSTTEDEGGVEGLIAFEAGLSSGEGNGTTIREVALMTAGAPIKMFARQVIGDIAKTSSITVDIKWRVQFSAA